MTLQERSDIADRLVRLRAGKRMPADLDWLRARESVSVLADPAALFCTCRCKCHAGACGAPIDLEAMDCERSCRSSHILGSDCLMDGEG